jgi:predicted nucleotidyltransferase
MREAYEAILRATGIADAQVHSVFPYGSRVYGSERADSDHDFIVVADGCVDGTEHRSEALNIHTYLPETFAHDLAEHRIHALECHFLPRSQCMVERVSRPFDLDIARLRHAISAKTSHSWVKAKKKLTVEVGQEWIGAKSLFHALRIAQFGIQIARDGRIHDYAGACGYWRQIRSMAEPMEQAEAWSWEPFNAYGKPIYNSLMSEFRASAPKGF